MEISKNFCSVIMKICFFLFSVSSYSINFTSTSHYDTKYSVFCEQAAGDAKTFSQFRNHPICRSIIETVSDFQGQQYLDVIKEKTPQLCYYFDKFKKNDLIGNPQTFSYKDVGYIAPTTLRYIKVAGDLLNLFGSLEDFSIIEIGGGYGGQCRILSALCKFKSYVIVDLPGPLLLAEKFLSDVENVSFVSHETNFGEQNFDLIISNYAFSECTNGVQRKYISDVLSKSKRGYLTCNNPVSSSPTRQPILEQRAEGVFSSKEMILNDLTNAHIPWIEIPEVPLTFGNNYLLVW